MSDTGKQERPARVAERHPLWEAYHVSILQRNVDEPFHRLEPHRADGQQPFLSLGRTDGINQKHTVDVLEDSPDGLHGPEITNDRGSAGRQVLGFRRVSRQHTHLLAARQQLANHLRANSTRPSSNKNAHTHLRRMIWVLRRLLRTVGFIWIGGFFWIDRFFRDGQVLLSRDVRGKNQITQKNHP